MCIWVASRLVPDECNSFLAKCAGCDHIMKKPHPVRIRAEVEMACNLAFTTVRAVAIMDLILVTDHHLGTTTAR